jgi:hypothetical protein
VLEAIRILPNYGAAQARNGYTFLSRLQSQPCGFARASIACLLLPDYNPLADLLHLLHAQRLVPPL